MESDSDDDFQEGQAALLERYLRNGWEIPDPPAAVVVRHVNEDGEVPWWEDDGEPDRVVHENLELDDFEFEDMPAVPDAPASPAKDVQRVDDPDVDEGEPTPPQSGESPAVDEEEGSLDDLPETL